MQNSRADTKASCRLDFFAGAQSTSAGSSEMDENEFAVIPNGPSLVAAVTTVTPVPKHPKASRKARVLSRLGTKLWQLSVIRYGSGVFSRSGRGLRIVCMSDELKRGPPGASPCRLRSGQFYFLLAGGGGRVR